MGAGIALGEGGSEGAEMAHSVGFVGREEELGVVNEVQRGDDVINGVNQVKQLGFGLGGKLKGAVVDVAVGIGGDKENVTFGDLVVAVFAGGGEQQLIEAELERVAVESGVAGPLFGVVIAGLKIVHGERFGVGVEINVVNLAANRNAGGGKRLAGEIDLCAGRVSAQNRTEALEGNGEVVTAALLELAQFGANQGLGLSLVVEVGEGVVVAETITGDAFKGLMDEVAVGEVEVEWFVGSAQEQAAVDGFGAGVDEVQEGGEVGGGEAVML